MNVKKTVGGKKSKTAKATKTTGEAKPKVAKATKEAKPKAAKETKPKTAKKDTEAKPKVDKETKSNTAKANKDMKKDKSKKSRKKKPSPFDLRSEIVSFDQIEEDLELFDNSRHVLENIDELMISIEENGLLNEPILWRFECEETEMPWGVVTERFFIIAGFRRCEAIRRLRKKTRSKALPFEELSVKLYEGDQPGAMRVNLTENLQRDDLTTFEVGLYCQEMINKTGIGQNELAAQIGKSKGWMSFVLNFVDEEKSDAIDDLRELVRERTIGLWLARDIAKKSSATQLKICNRIKSAARMSEKKDSDGPDPLKGELDDLKAKLSAEKKARKRGLRGKAEVEGKLEEWRSVEFSSLTDDARNHGYTIMKTLEWMLNSEVDWEEVEPKSFDEYGTPSFVLESNEEE